MLKAFLLIVVGLAGDPEHAKTFQKWGATLAEASSPSLACRPNVSVLSRRQAGRGHQGVTGAPTREENRQGVREVSQAGGPED
jgi:hypothetical protein